MVEKRPEPSEYPCGGIFGVALIWLLAGFFIAVALMVLWHGR